MNMYNRIMNEIICPHCKKAFKIDEAGFADILKQVRDSEFDQELHERIQILERDKESAVKLAEERTKNELQANVCVPHGTPKSRSSKPNAMRGWRR